MPTLAGITVFMAGRHSIGLTTLADDDDETRIVALRVRVDEELVGTVDGDWRDDDHDGIEAAALAYIKAHGIPLQDA